MASVSLLPDNPALFLRELRRRAFTDFLHKAWPYISGGEDVAWNWHLDAIAHQLDAVRRGDNLRLLVTMPPRNGKSKTISVIWVAWMLGLDPRRTFVCVSYSNELSGKLARDCLATMQSAWYRELFPRTIISTKRSATADFETTAGGGRISTSVTGTLTGRGGDIIILDDVIKPEEANSDTTRNAVNAWYQSTLASRLDDKRSGAIICVMQRLHQYDLAGVLIEGGGWRELKLAAIATDDEAIALTRGRVYHRRRGEVLHPAREPLTVLERQREMMGSILFSAQYQQEPVPAEGNIFKAEWLNWYEPAPAGALPGQIVQSWDTASKDGANNDFSVCITAHVSRAEVRVLDVFRARLAFPDLKHHAIRLAREHRAQVILIEDQASGTQLLQTLRSEQPHGVVWPIQRRPESDKQSRALGVSAMIEAGQLLLPQPPAAPWLAEFQRELLAFPSSRYDDQVDAVTQLLTWVQKRQIGASGPPIDGGYAIIISRDDDDETFFNQDDPENETGLY